MALDPSTNKTGNAIPSSGALDLEDNTRVFDTLINDLTEQEVLDRFGVARKSYSLWQLEADTAVSNFITASDTALNDFVTAGDNAIQNFNTEAQQVLDLYRASYIGDYVIPNKTFTTKTDFVQWATGDGGDGNLYVYVGPESNLPYTTDIATYPDPNSDPNLQVQNPLNILEVQTEVNAGDSQLAGGNIWPLSSQDEASNGDVLTSDFVNLRLNQMVNKILERGTGSTLSNINTGDLTVEIDGVLKQLNPIPSNDRIFDVTKFGAKGGDPGHDDYFGILRAVNAINRSGGGTLYFPNPGGDQTYYVNQYRIDPGAPDANGITNFRFEQVPVKIVGNNSKLKMIGGWTRRQNNGLNSYDNCVGFEFRRCLSVSTEDLSINGGAETITFQAPVEGVSYGMLYAGCENIHEKNLDVSYYTTDGIAYSRENAEASEPYDEVVCKNVVAINTKSSFNGRQATSTGGLRNGVFINCKYTESGKSAYGGHAPQACVDIEPSASPVTPTTTDEFTGNLSYYGCFFGLAVGSPFVASGGDRVFIRGHITHYDCTYDATGSSDQYIVVNTENFTSYNPELINCTIAPSLGTSLPAVNNIIGGSSEISVNAARMYECGVNVELNIDGTRFNYSPPAIQTGEYISHAGTGVVKNCKHFISEVATPDPTQRHTAASFSNSLIELERNSWDTDLNNTGFYSILTAGIVRADKYLDPNNISPTTAVYTQTLYSRGSDSADEIKGNFGYLLFFGNPKNGQFYTRGDTAIIPASAGGKGFNKCTTSGTQGVDAVFKLCGVIDS